MVALAFSHSAQGQKQADIYEFEARSLYMLSTRPASTIQKDPISKYQKINHLSRLYWILLAFLFSVLFVVDTLDQLVLAWNGQKWIYAGYKKGFTRWVFSCRPESLADLENS